MCKPTPLHHFHRLPPISAMAGEDCSSGAEMDALVRRLRLHRPPPSPYDPEPAAAPVPGTAGDGELFRPRRAAVLVCLFRGDGGELRVILTKRSSSLSTHSGEQLLSLFLYYYYLLFWPWRGFFWVRLACC